MRRSLIRILAFTSNWRALVWRQPWMLLSMIIGPFAVLLLFGIGNSIFEAPPKTILVNQGQGQQSEYQLSPKDLSTYLNVVETTDSLDHALAELRARNVRLVMVIPADPAGTIQSGRHAVIRVFINEIDPVRLAFAQLDIKTQVATVNSNIEGRLIDSIKGPAANLNRIVTQFGPILQAVGVSQFDLNNARQAASTLNSAPTEVLTDPFEAQLQNIAPVQPTVVTYFIPAAIALIIQHLAVTLAGLSMIRARLLGTIELWRIAPVKLGEIVAGNYFSYGLLIMVAGAILVAAIIYALALPILGSLYVVAASIVLLIFASLGYGFLISIISKNEQTATQLTMIVFLASLFLGGFVTPLEQITPGVRVVSYLLPATYEAEILKETMLRGEQGNTIYYVAMAVIGLATLVIATVLLGRELKSSKRAGPAA